MKTRKRINDRRRSAALAAVAVSAAFLLIQCGRKGALYLEPRPEPPMVSQVNLRQVGTQLEISWTFPPLLMDGKTEFDPTRVRWVRFYHANRQLPGDSFQRRATALDKIPITDLVHKGNEYSYRIPFKINELSGKKHFFSIRYAYLRYKAPFSPVKRIDTAIPPKPVTGLEVSQEGKTILLRWKRPDRDLSDETLKSLAGYTISRRIVSAESPSGDSQIIRITPRFLHDEKYKDTDTSLEGRYEYRIVAHFNAEIESLESETVSVTMQDTFPPDLPSGVVVFRARDHLLLNWRPVHDRDFSHYRIYRRVDKESEEKLLVDQLKDTHYEDRSVKPGHSYAYQVTAVDLKGNESDPSTPVDENF